MKCMKCGRKIDDTQVFCEDCLLDMEKFPIKPGTVVQLPKRSETSGAKKANSRRRGNLSLEEQVKLLKKRIHLLTAALVLALALIAVLAFFTVEHLVENPDFLPGQNYSAVTSSESVEAE